MRSFGKAARVFGKVTSGFLEKWRWHFLALSAIFVVLLEYYEYLNLHPSPFHLGETFIYLSFIAFIGLLIEVNVRANRSYEQMGKILEHKHNLSLELALNDDWESLTARLVELPRKIVKGVDEVYLLVNDSIVGSFEVAGHWVENEDVLKNGRWDPAIPCSICLEMIPDQKTNFHICLNKDESPDYHAYSLGITDHNFPTTVLKFKLKSGTSLSGDEERIFNNIGDEIAVALQASQDRQRLSEMQSTKVRMEERRMVSAYVHDQLGQNLGFLHLKLDQLGSDERFIKSAEVRRELQYLREVANESYEIVRDILKNIQPDTIPNLTNLLKEYSRTVSRRAHFSLNFESRGVAVPLATLTQQLIFFTFREILSNVEKHAAATKVDVLVIWNNGFLDISVADDGKGFDPHRVRGDEHFGLQIMQERISGIKGNLVINSSTDSGTVVSISVPLAAAILESL